MNEIKNNKNLRIIAVSDNHGEYYNTKNLVNESGDIIIFAGNLNDIQVILPIMERIQILIFSLTFWMPWRALSIKL